MNKTTRSIIMHLLNKKIFNRHKPEQKVLKNKIKYLSENERKEFEDEYKQLVNEDIIIREKKRTGKGTAYHIRLNPRKLKEAYELLGENDEED